MRTFTWLQERDCGGNSDESGDCEDEEGEELSLLWVRNGFAYRGALAHLFIVIVVGSRHGDDGLSEAR